MTVWTEQTLRGAASWKAFKEGKALFEGGAVTESQITPTGWRGSLKSGKRPIRVSVIAKSPTDLETRCSCPENQATGVICGHAVAAGLAALAGSSKSAPQAPTPAAKPPAVARTIYFPPNWPDSLSRGKLAATLTLSPSAGIHPADVRLTNWLENEDVKPRETHNLHLDGTRVAAFLNAITDHPDVVYGNDRLAILISTGHRIELTEATHENNRITLKPAADVGQWSKIGSEFWQISQNSITRAGDGPAPASLMSILPALASGQPVEIPTQRLLENLSSWQDWFTFPENGWLDSLHFVPAPATFHLALDGSLQEMHARLTVSYDDSTAVLPGFGIVENLPRLTDGRCLIRNFSAEQSAVHRLESAGFQNPAPAASPWTLRGESSIISFLTQTLPSLREVWKITEESRFATAHQQITVITPRIDILSSGEDWLGFDLTFQTNDGIKIPRDEVHKLLRSGKASGKTQSGRRLVVSEHMLDLIEPLFAELDLRQNAGHYEASAAAGEVILDIRNKLHKHSTSNDLQDSLTFNSPSSLQADLRPYQAFGAAWLSDRLNRYGGALLADDMGLGKTIQTIALIEQLFTSNHAAPGVVLVIATASLLGNWQAEFARFAPGRRVRILHGSGRDDEREQVEAGDLILTSYGTLARDLAWHLKREYMAVIVDEASLMRNPDTDHAKAVSKLRSSRRIALTGTPVENGLRDLWSIFRFIQPGWLGSRAEFRDRYETPLQSGEAAGSVMERLKLKTQPFLLRRTKEQVAPELPSKLLIDEFCDLSSDQQAVYRDLLVEGRKRVETISDSGNPGAARMQMLTALLRLRQTCCDLALLGNDRLKQLPVARRSTKIQRLLELLEEAISGGHKILVFSQFQKQLLEIEKFIHERDWKHLRLDGQSRNRQQLVDQFQSPDGPPVFLISLKAGGYGLNLTAADTVIHFDPWWNPAAEAQATDRTHRIGQTRPVTVYRLLTRGTVEEKVVRLQARKRNIAASIDESGTGDSPTWSMSELEAVMG